MKLVHVSNLLRTDCLLHTDYQILYVSINEMNYVFCFTVTLVFSWKFVTKIRAVIKMFLANNVMSPDVNT